MNKFKKTETGLQGMIIFEPTVYADDRGFFLETYNKKDFESLGFRKEFVQDNQSHSQKGVLRGLHRQVAHPQGKLVRVLSGEVFDVGVDVRKESETFGRWFGIILSSENKKSLYIPEGFLHGFLVLSQEAEFAYKCTDYYYSEDEDGILWNDPEIGIKWPLDLVGQPILSQKDKNLKSLNLIQ
ncbi:MAG: dTDP-4-dehydrorhamnose 3,5-epimerase [Bacillota bacterium]|nr:dTDP-4-dehydrorhamnose 3,5-epimerase [Bacillota bacterium]